MQLIDRLSIKHIIRRPIYTIDKPPLFLMIHGYGSNEQDLFSFSQELPDHFFIISLRGFYSVQLNFSWYNLQILSEGLSSDRPQALLSRNKIASFIEDAILHYQLDEKNVWLCGFSQGAILSYAIALSTTNLIHKVIALSGFLQQDLISNNINKDISCLNFFISHGVYDEIIPISWAKQGPKFLKSFHIPYFYKEYAAGHECNAANYKDMMQWIFRNKNI